MAKTIIKELIIILLLCLSIILVLGILFYEYVPMTKTIPNPVSYTTPEDVKQELLTSEGVDENKIIMTYEVDSTDLNNYKKIQDYKPGKANPFSSYAPSTNNTTNGQTTNGTSNTGSSNNTGNTGSTENSSENNTTTSGGQYFQDKGTK